MADSESAAPAPDVAATPCGYLVVNGTVGVSEHYDLDLDPQRPNRTSAELAQGAVDVAGLARRALLAPRAHRYALGGVGQHEAGLRPAMRSSNSISPTYW